MDATSIYPEGFHPFLQLRQPDGNGTARVISRYEAHRPVTYYFVDFGISTHFQREQDERLVVGEDGIDKDVPELSPSVPYDPFKVDIFILGNVFRREIYAVSRQIEYHYIVLTES